MRTWTRNALILGLLGSLLMLTVFSVWLAGCSANEPFDPESLENASPTIRMMVSPPPDDGELNATSYFERTFNWSGSDRDGWVANYFVSVRTDGDNSAPWDTTTSTDTTMTFSPDPQSGEASATFLVACVDNRGAYSDTVEQFIPMRNFPPTVTFQSGFEPKQNLQRDVSAEGDTVFWNWGPNAFLLTAFDLDGRDTMDDFYRYTMAEGDPDQEWDLGDPEADVETGWIRAPFVEGTESYEFEIFIPGIAEGERTLTVSVQDEAGGDPLFQYSWIVREPKSPILYFPDNGFPQGRAMYESMLDLNFGQDNWDSYTFLYGFPDRLFVLLETMRLFDVVLWTSGGGTSAFLTAATSRDGVLEQYVIPQDDSDPGRLLFVSRFVAGEGTQGPSPVFIGNVLGINASASAPVNVISRFSGWQAQPQDGGNYLPFFTGINNSGEGRGMDPNSDTEVLYRMEENSDNCYQNSSRPRPPCDPVVAIRRPHRDVDPFASVVCFSVLLENFDNDQVIDMLSEVLANEMGVEVR